MKTEIELAKQAGWEYADDDRGFEPLWRFAELVRADERARMVEQPAQQEPVAHVMFRQDEDGLEPVMFCGPGTAPDPATLKDRFVLKDVWLSPPAQRTWVGLTNQEREAVIDNSLTPACVVLATEAKLKEKNT